LEGSLNLIINFSLLVFSLLLSVFQSLRDIFGFLAQRKKWWLIPLVVVLLVSTLLIIAGGGTALSPFIYTLF
jgi:hypothetical protein